MFDEKFENLLMQAIVTQFFENPPMYAYLQDGQQVAMTHRVTPVQAVAERVLVAKNDELLTAIVAALDLDEFATKVSAIVIKELTGSTSGFHQDAYRNAARQKAIREKVDERLVELLAADIHAKMKADAEANDHNE